MPKKRKKEFRRCEFYGWLIGQRNGVYFADGRSNQPSLGRHSLNTRDYELALGELRELDRRKAVEFGKVTAVASRTAAASAAGLDTCPLLELARGRDLYLAHVRRPTPLGGARAKTAQRYTAVFDKLLPFLRNEGLQFWNAVNARVVERYATSLNDKGYSAFTLYFEVVTIKQTVKWLIRQGLLPESHTIHVKVLRPHNTTTRCWRREEVDAMLDHCFADQKLQWLGRVLLALAMTGLRIGELADLRWTDIDLDARILTLPDRHLHAVHGKRAAARSTKGKRDRCLPLHEDLLPVLRALPRNRADGRVFRAACGGPLDPDKVRIALKRDVQKPLAARFRKMGDEPSFEDGTPHSFRHYFVSTAANDGVAERVVQDWVGHKDSKMVHWYYHLHSEHSREQMQKMSKSARRHDAAWRRSISPENAGRTPAPDKGTDNPE